jgi:hypothetical protein
MPCARFRNTKFDATPSRRPKNHLDQLQSHARRISLTPPSKYVRIGKGLFKVPSNLLCCNQNASTSTVVSGTGGASILSCTAGPPKVPPDPCPRLLIALSHWTDAACQSCDSNHDYWMLLEEGPRISTPVLEIYARAMVEAAWFAWSSRGLNLAARGSP